MDRNLALKSRFNTLDWLALAGLAFYNLASISGRLSFGMEMGDIGYWVLLIIGTFLLVMLYLLKWQGIWKKHGWILTIVSWTFLFFIIWESSFGRGPEYPWNGAFFT